MLLSSIRVQCYPDTFSHKTLSAVWISEIVRITEVVFVLWFTAFSHYRTVSMGQKKRNKCIVIHTVQQALRVKWQVFFGVFVCFGLYFVNYRSWQAEILQERAEGCIQVDLQKKIRQDKNNAFLFCGFVGVVFGHKFKVV